MRDQIERLVLLPFSIGCISESSIAVGEQFPNRTKSNEKLTPIGTKEDDHVEAEESTDVKHVTHIGVDGSATSILSKGWDNLKTVDLPVFPPSLDLLIKPAHVPTDFCAYPPPIHSTSSPLSMTAEVSPNLLAAAPVHSAASPFAMLSRVQSHVRSTPSPLAMPAQVHQLNSKGA